MNEQEYVIIQEKINDLNKKIADCYYRLRTLALAKRKHNNAKTWQERNSSELNILSVNLELKKLQNEKRELQAKRRTDRKLYHRLYQRLESVKIKKRDYYERPEIAEVMNQAALKRYYCLKEIQKGDKA